MTPSDKERKAKYGREICSALQDLREGRLKTPEKDNDKAFHLLTGVNTATAKAIKDVAYDRTGGITHLPDTETIARYVTGCGSSMSEFFAGMEAVAAKEPGRRIVGYEAHYDLLTNIIEAKQATQGTDLLLMFARSHHIEIPEGLVEEAAEAKEKRAASHSTRSANENQRKKLLG